MFTITPGHQSARSIISRLSRLKPTTLLKKYGWDLVSLGFIAGFLLFCLFNFNFFPSPHGDIFQYIRDGRVYFSNELPSLMQIPPLFPVLIQVLKHALFFTTFAEFKIAILMNTLGTTGSLVLIWWMGRKLLHPLAMTALLATLITSPFTLLTTLNVTPEPFLLFFVLLAFFLWREKRQKNWALLVAGISAMVKSEGMLVVALISLSSMTLNDLKQLKNPIAFLKKNWGMTAAFTFIILWSIVSTLNNFHHEIPFGNRYLEELSLAKHLFDFRFFHNLQAMLLSPIDILFGPYPLPTSTAIVNLIGLALITIVLRKSNLFLPLIFAWGYLLVHSFFPAHENRYYFPVLPILFLGLYAAFQKLFSRNIVTTLLLVGVSIFLTHAYLTNQDIRHHVIYSKEYRAGYASVGQWFEKDLPVTEKKVVVFSTEPYFIYAHMQEGGYLDFAVNNITFDKNYNAHLQSRGTQYVFINLEEVEHYGCNSITCLISLIPAEFQNFYVVYTYDNLLNDYLPFFKKSVALTTNSFDKHCFKEVATFERDWAQIVKYDLEGCADLLQEYQSAERQ